MQSVMTLRVPSETLSKARKLAKEKDLSLNAFVAKCVTDELAKHFPINEQAEPGNVDWNRTPNVELAS